MNGKVENERMQVVLLESEATGSILGGFYRPSCLSALNVSEGCLSLQPGGLSGMTSSMLFS